jgi:hypothetical protein
MNTVTKRTLITIVLLTIAISGCRRTSPSSTRSSSTPVASSSQTALSHPDGGTTVLPETKYFEGSIGSSLDLQMKLVKTGEQLTGSYFYQHIGTRINLRGTLDKDGNITLEEFDPAGKQTGLFKGLWQVNKNDGLITVAGNWSKPPGDKAADKKTAFSIHEEPIYLTGDADVITKQIKENNKKLVYEINASYPQITGTGNPNFEKFNQAVRGSVSKSIAEFKKNLAATPDQEPPPADSMHSDLTIEYEIGLAQDDLVSVLLFVSSYYQGAAHPLGNSDVVNFDLKNGKVLKLSDLFKPGAKYLPALSTYCISDLKKQSKDKQGMLDDTSINNGASPNAKNYKSWTIRRNGIGVEFDAYQVGPYAAGAQAVVVPYSALKDWISPEGPAGQFAK